MAFYVRSTIHEGDRDNSTPFERRGSGLGTTSHFGMDYPYVIGFWSKALPYDYSVGDTPSPSLADDGRDLRTVMCAFDAATNGVSLFTYPDDHVWHYYLVVSRNAA